MTLDPALKDALKSFVSHRRVLVAMDFDGTLSRLVARPQDARPTPEAAEYLEKLSQLPGVQTAVVSGRNLASLEEVYPEPRPVIQIGSHGAERVLPEDLSVTWGEEPLSASQHAALQVVTERMDQIAERHAGVTVEYKPSASVLHVRRASDEVGEAALSEALKALQGMQDVKLMSGKAVLEASVHQGDKGKALSWLRDVLEVDAVLFAGDDVTDENGFRVLKNDDVGIKVGDGETSAAYRINSTDEVADLLKELFFMRH